MNSVIDAGEAGASEYSFCNEYVIPDDFSLDAPFLKEGRCPPDSFKSRAQLELKIPNCKSSEPGCCIKSTHKLKSDGDRCINANYSYKISREKDKTTCSELKLSKKDPTKYTYEGKCPDSFRSNNTNIRRRTLPDCISKNKDCCVETEYTQNIIQSINDGHLKHPVRARNFPDDPTTLWITCRGHPDKYDNLRGGGLFKYDIGWSGKKFKFLEGWTLDSPVEGLFKLDNFLIVAEMGRGPSGDAYKNKMLEDSRPTLHIFRLDLDIVLSPIISLDLSSETDAILHVECTKFNNRAYAICSSGFATTNSVIIVDITDVIEKKPNSEVLKNLKIIKIPVDVHYPEGINISPTCPHVIYTGGIIMHSMQHVMRIARVDLHELFNNESAPITYISNNGGPVGGQLVGASRIDQPIFEEPHYGSFGYNDFTLYLSGWGYPGRFGILDTESDNLEIIEDSDFSFMNRVKLWRNYAFLPLEIKHADFPVMDDLFKGVVGVIDITTKEKKILDTSSKSVTGLDHGNETLDGIYTLAVNCDNLYVFPPNEQRVVVYDIFWIIEHLFGVDLRSNNDNPCNKDLSPQGFPNINYNKFSIDRCQFNTGPYIVYIVRHGEKQSYTGSLSGRGQARAINLINVFNGERFSEPKALYAHHYGNLVDKERCEETIKPISTHLNLWVNNSYGYLHPPGFGNTIAGLDILLNLPSKNVILVVWEHFNIQFLTHDLGVGSELKNRAIPDWPDEDFDTIYELHYNNPFKEGLYKFTISKQKFN